jgi:Beta-ketoacyl synthase, N-terminal domain
VAVTAATFHIERWAACGAGLAPGQDGIAYVRGESGRASEILGAEPALPPLLRRRVSSIGQMALRAASGIGDTGAARFVFCSRHGEFERTLRILTSLVDKEPVSPADFSLSVHNALAGLLSMAAKNENGHTAIAARGDSFGFGLIESASCLAARPEKPVFLIYYDEPLPGAYNELGDPDETPIALALLLRPRRGETGDISVAFEPVRGRGPARAASQQALDFAKLLMSCERESRSVGERMVWCWRHAA